MTKEEQYLKDDLKNAVWIGEDGGMAVSGKLTKIGAWRKMRALLREDCGNIEAEEFRLDSIEIGFLRLATEEERKGDYYDSEWFITRKKTQYPVWVYWG